MTTAIIGGGISGLSAAHYLSKLQKSSILVFESSSVLGGWIRTLKDPITGVKFEKGPRTIRPHGVQGLNTLALIEDLNLHSKVCPIKRSDPSAKNRLIYLNGQLHKLPSDLSALFRTTPPFSKPLISCLAHDLLAPKKTCDDDSIYNFIERRFGKELAEYIISPLICGICAGNAKEISVKFLAPSLFSSEQTLGRASLSMIKDMLTSPFSKKDGIEGSELAARASKEHWSVWGLEGGLQSLTDTLGSTVVSNGVEIQKNTRVEKISFKNGAVSVKLASKEVDCQHVICSLPAKNLAPLLADEHPQLSALLSQIRPVNVAVVNLVYRGQVLSENAFGFLVPPVQKLPILGVIFDSCSFPQGDYTVLTAMLGGYWFKEHFGNNSNDQYILDVTLDQVNRILGLKTKPLSYHVAVLNECIPQYTLGHNQRVADIFEYIKSKKLPLSLIGSSYNGVGINDVILSAKNAVNNIEKS